MRCLRCSPAVEIQAVFLENCSNGPTPKLGLSHLQISDVPFKYSYLSTAECFLLLPFEGVLFFLQLSRPKFPKDWSPGRNKLDKRPAILEMGSKIGQDVQHGEGRWWWFRITHQAVAVKIVKHQPPIFCALEMLPGHFHFSLGALFRTVFFSQGNTFKKAYRHKKIQGTNTL